MTDEDDSKTPQTVKEVGIHLGYLRKDISALTKLVEKQTQTYATKAEVLSMQQLADTVHASIVRDIKDLQSWNKWVARLVLGALILSALALLISKNVT